MKIKGVEMPTTATVHTRCFQHHGKNRAVCYLAEIFQSGEAFDQTSFADVAKGHTEYKDNRNQDENCHEKDTWQDPYIWFHFLNFFLHRDTSFYKIALTLRRQAQKTAFVTQKNRTFL